MSEKLADEVLDTIRILRDRVEVVHRLVNNEHPEDILTDVLDASVGRVVDGVDRLRLVADGLIDQCQKLARQSSMDFETAMGPSATTYDGATAAPTVNALAMRQAGKAQP